MTDNKARSDVVTEVANRLGLLRRLLGAYFVGAALLIYLWMILPHPEGVNDLGVGLAAGGMVLVGTSLLARPQADIGPWALNAALTGVTASTSLVYYFSGRPGGTFILLYVWSVPFAFALVRFEQAAAQGLFAVGCLITVVNLRPITLKGQVLSTSVIGVVSLLAVGLLVDRLMRYLLASRADREQLALQLAQSQRLESLGQLAGGVAHDFNNLLAVIANYASFVADSVADRPNVHADVEQIQEAAERGSDLVHQLLTFARQEVVDREALILNDVVAEVDRLLRRSLGEHIELRCDLEVGLWPALADRGQIGQVLVNLAVNARDAMPDGGTLTVDTANVEVDEHYTAGRPELTVGRWVRLRVTDTGTGMNDLILRQAFDPFFTTKAKGRGNGLGLASIHGIISQANGYCHLYSEVGHGTTFTALLPASDQQANTMPDSTEPAAAGGPETILVVEDEPAIREVARRVLESGGYSVLLASDGHDALTRAEQHDATIDLLLTDVVMPNLSGKDLADQLKQIRPTTKVIFMSGYADHAFRCGTEANARIEMLEKPFSGPSLLAKVRSVLDG